MTKNQSGKRPVTSVPAAARESQPLTLAKLQRLYGHRGPRADAFGRRAALPSEIQRLTAARRAWKEQD